MAEYTRDIQQLQKTASQQPQFAPPSQSLGGDIVNLVGTGLDFYAKNKAQGELDLRVKAQKEQEKQFAQGTLGLRQLRQELSGQGLSSTEFRKRENDYIKKFSPEMAMGILKETNTLTGTNTYKMTSEMDKAEQARATERKTLEESVNGLKGFLNEPIDFNADSESLRVLELKGNAIKAEHEAKKSKAALLSTQLGNREKANTLDGELHLMDYGLLAGNEYTKQANSLIQGMDFNNSASVQDARTRNNDFRRMFFTSAVATARDKGIILTETDVREQLPNQIAVFDEMDRLLSRKDIAEQSTAQMQYKVNSITEYLSRSKNKTERDLGSLLMLSKILPTNSALANKISEQYGAALINGLGDNVFTLEDRAVQQAGTTAPNRTTPQGGILKETFNFVKDVFKAGVDSIPLEAREAYTATILEDLQGSNAKKERILNNGALVTYVDAIGNGNPENIIAEGKETEVLEGVMNNAGQFMRRAIPQILNQQLPMNQDFFNKPMPPKGNIFPATKKAVNYLDMVDPVTLKISWKNKAGISPAVRKYNKFVEDTFKSMEKLGASDDEMEYFRSQVMEGFNVANIQ